MRQLIFALCLALLPVAASAQQPASTAAAPAGADPVAVRTREAERVKALVARDYDRLETMLSPTLTYTHSNGLMDRKDAFLAPLRSGKTVYKQLDHKEVEVRFASPDVAIMNGISDVVVTVDGKDQQVPLRFTIVYVRRGGEWLLEAWQSTRRPQ